jgi:hypothetical protein
MPDPKEPVDYRNPHTPDAPRTWRNFGVGFVVGLAAAGVPWALGAVGASGSIVMAVAISLLVGYLVAAAVVSVKRRHPGVAQGMLVALGVALLVNGGICFIYTAQHI